MLAGSTLELLEANNNIQEGEWHRRREAQRQMEGGREGGRQRERNTEKRSARKGRHPIKQPRHQISSDRPGSCSAHLDRIRIRCIMQIKQL